MPPVVDDDDDDDVQPASTGKPSLLVPPPPPPGGPTDGTRRFPPFSGRPNDGGSTPTPEADRELTARSKLAELLAKYRKVDDAKIAAHRVSPEVINGEPAKGFSKRYAASQFQTVEDLLEAVEREFGGYVWDFKFTAPNASGTDVYAGASRSSINSPPLAKRKDQVLAGGGNGNGVQVITQQAPETELMKEVIQVFKDNATKADKDRDAANNRKPSSDDQAKMMQIMADLAEKNNSSQVKTLERIVESYKEQLNQVRTEMERRAESMNGPNAELMKHLSQTGTTSLVQSQKDSQTAIERASQDHARERQSLIERHERQVELLTEKLKQVQEDSVEQTEKLTEKLNAALDKASEERRVLNERADQREKSLMQQHQMQLDNARRDRDNDISRITAERDAERRNMDMFKIQFDANLKSQMDSQKMFYEAQMEGYKNRIGEMERKLNDAIKVKDDLLDQRLREASAPKPDTLTTMAETMRAIRGVAGDLGFSKDKDKSEEPPETETASTIRALKETGIIDGAGRIIAQLAQNMRPPAPTAPPVVYQVPINPTTGMPFFPPANQMPMVAPSPAQVVRAAPVQRASRFSESSPPPSFQTYREPNAAPPTEATPPGPSRRHEQQQAHQSHQQVQQQQHQAPQQQQPSQPAPDAASGAVTAEQEAQLRIISQTLQKAMEDNEALDVFAQQMVVGFGKEAIVAVLNGGVTEFKDMIEHVDPDSTLLSIRGDEWLRALFAEVAKIVE